MRILHISTRHRHGGAERNLAATVAWEVGHGHEVHLAVGADSLFDEAPAGATVTPIPDLVRAVSAVHDVRAYRSLRRLIGAGGFDLVQTHQSKAGILGRLAAQGRSPLIVHTIHMASFGSAYNPIASAAFVAAERWCAGFTTRIVSVGSELTQMYLKAGVGRQEQYVVMRSPIEIDAFARRRVATMDERDRARRELGLVARTPVVVVLASLEPRKRVDLVIRALAPLAAGGELQLVVGGDGPARSELEGLARRLDAGSGVRFLGYVADPAAVMIAADVLVHAATVEGVPQVVIQALAAGVPVVATQMIGLREVPGAPIAVSDAGGDNLAGLVARVLGDPPAPVAMSELEPWRPSSIDAARTALYDALERPLG